MKRSPLLLTALLLTVPPAGAGEVADPAPPTKLTAEEREKAAGYFEDVARRLREEVLGLTDAQWRFRSGDDRWTISEIVEHMAIGEERILGRVVERVVATPVRDPGDRSRITDLAVRMAVTNRTAQRLQAPEPVQPKGRDWTPAEALAEYDRIHEAMVEYVRTTEDDLRGHVAENPVLGLLDGYQWLLFAGGHTERHLGQIREVKEQPGYPGS